MKTKEKAMLAAARQQRWQRAGVGRGAAALQQRSGGRQCGGRAAAVAAAAPGRRHWQRGNSGSAVEALRWQQEQLGSIVVDSEAAVRQREQLSFNLAAAMEARPQRRWGQRGGGGSCTAAAQQWQAAW
jgi:hypothetical protein